MLKVGFCKFGMIKITFYEWYKRFQDHCEYVEDGERPRCHSIAVTDKNRKKLKK